MLCLGIQPKKWCLGTIHKLVLLPLSSDCRSTSFPCKFWFLIVVRLFFFLYIRSKAKGIVCSQELRKLCLVPFWWLLEDLVQVLLRCSYFSFPVGYTGVVILTMVAISYFHIISPRSLYIRLLLIRLIQRSAFIRLLLCELAAADANLSSTFCTYT